MRPESGNGRGRSRIELTRLNTVVFAPIHKASVRRSEEHTSELQSLRHLVCLFLNDTATTEIYPLSLHDALPISGNGRGRSRIELTRLNTVVFAPIHKASVRVAVNQRIGSRRSPRTARRKFSIISPLQAPAGRGATSSGASSICSEPQSA